MQAQLRELESKILTHVAEMQGQSAREAAASLGLTLQKEGVVGVTEEVRSRCPQTHRASHRELEAWAVSHCQRLALPGHKWHEEALTLPWAQCGWVEVAPIPAWVSARYKPSRVSPQVPGLWQQGTGQARLLPTVTVSWGRALAGAPDCKAGPAALQRGPHWDGGLRPGIGR